MAGWSEMSIFPKTQKKPVRHQTTFNIPIAASMWSLQKAPTVTLEIDIHQGCSE